MIKHLKLFLATILAMLLILGAAMALGPDQDTRAGSVLDPGSPRIVSLAPSITEILYALGMDQQIVGVTAFCNYPRQAADKPKVGDFKGANLEALIALKPDLVIATRDGNLSRNIQTLEQLGIRFITYEPKDLESVIEQIASLGENLNRTNEALALAEECRGKLNLVKDSVKGASEVSVLLAYGREPLVLAGQGTFADDMISIAGGVNIAADSKIPYPRFSMEEVIARAPAVIIEGGMGSEAKDSAQAAWSEWPGLPAVKSGRVHVLDEDLIARTGPRIFDGLIEMARVLHPEIFNEDSP